eukprot:gene6502-10510_t
MSEEAVKKATEYLLDNFDWKAEYPNSELIEARLDADNSAHKGISLFYRHIKQEKPRGVVFLFHGLGESSTFYGALANNLCLENYEVFMMDQQGHGKSYGHEKCDISDFKILYENGWFFIFRMLHKYQDRLRNLPMFLFGLSMGGSTVLEMLLHPPTNFSQKIGGCIVVAPAIIAAGKPNAGLLPLIKASSYLVPVFNAKQLDYKTITSLPKIQKKLENHKERFAFVPSTLGRELLSMEEDLNQNMTKLKTPMLILQSVEDQIVEKKGAEKLWQSVSCDDVVYQEYHGCQHNVIHDVTVFTSHKRIIDWLNERSTEEKVEKKK